MEERGGTWVSETIGWVRAIPSRGCGLAEDAEGEA